MWHRPFLSIVLFLLVAIPALAQVSGVYSRAYPPDKAVVERLNLKTEWTINLPIDGKKDAISLIQTLEDQIFVQTRSGRIFAIDALTGRLQWHAILGNGGFVNTYPIATNSQFAFVANVTKIFSFHRYTGVVEFMMDMDTTPSAGMSADEQSLYCVLGINTKASSAQRVASYKLPQPIVIQTAPKVDASGKPIRDPKSVDPLDSLMNRYPPEGASRAIPNADSFEGETRRSRPVDAPIGGYSGSRTPSIQSMPRITQPYTLDSDINNDSINLLPSLRRPYHLRNEGNKDIQQVASIGTIPPSIAAALALSDLRPKGVTPGLRWEFGATSKVLFAVALTPLRVWVTTDSRQMISLSKIDKKIEAIQAMDDPISAAPGRAGLFMYVPLGSGFLIAIDGSTGTLGGGANVQWRTTVGGIGNRTPFVTENMVYAQGDNSGVVCVDRKSGDVLWRTESTADHVLAANKEFLYVRNRQGKLLVYDAKKATDPAGKRSLPLAGIDLSDFNIPITNTVTDRLYLAADNGLIVCLRDMSSKYARPVRICPEASVNALPKEGVTTNTKDSKEPKEAAPKDKDEMKK